MAAAKPAARSKPANGKPAAGKPAKRAGPATVAEYMEALPPEKREAMDAALKLVRKHIPKGYVEFMNWGVINWVIPLAEFAETHNGQPLGYVGLGAQKNYISLYLFACYGQDVEHLKEEFKKAGKRFDMGKCCLHFKTLDDLELKSVTQMIASKTPAQYLTIYKKEGRFWV